MGGAGDVWNPSDFNFLVLQGCIEIGAAPQVDGWFTEMTPVDFAAKAIVQLARDSDNVGATFRVTNSVNCRPATEYFDVIRKFGIPLLDSCSLEEWWRTKVLNSDSLALQNLRNALQGGATADVAALKDLSACDNEEFAAKCASLGLGIPKITPSVMRASYVKEWRNAGMVMTPLSTMMISSAKNTGKHLLLQEK
jgi:hypothetical protein